MFKQLCFIFFLTGITILNAQTNWIRKDLFEQKIFIENKGQFNPVSLPDNEPVLFAAKIDGVNYYFTKTGYTIGRKTKVEKTEEEKEKYFSKPKEEDDAEKSNFKIIELFHQVKFVNPNPDVDISAKNKVSNYYTYSDLKSEKKKGTIIAKAFSKLIYKNIYPNTDIVFEFPKDSTGIKYSIYLHPGADITKVKLVFPNNPDLKLKNNAIEIITSFGKIIDHQPVSFTTDKLFIKSAFKINGNQVGFEIENKFPDKTIIIDPWTVTPDFNGESNAYDIDYDNLGNVYVYGGIASGTFTLLKYNSAGNLIWSYSPTLFSNPLPNYGDFAVDKNSGNIYIVEGLNPDSGSQVVKINSNAIQLSVFAGSPQFREMWRIAFSGCTHQAVIAGGGTSIPTYQTCLLDSNLSTLSPVQYIPSPNCCHDAGLLALDNYGNCYQETNLSASYADGLYENQLVKLPVSSLSNPTYHVNTNYAFTEGSSIMYYDTSGFAIANGYNGLTTSGTIVYSYDSYVLKKWDGPTGNLLTLKRINYPSGGDSSKIYWGGISADDCGNLFLADSNTVRQYDTTLTLINSYTMPNIITDINWSSSSNILYVCGLGFATSISLTGTINCNEGGALTLSATIVNSTCNTTGSATANISGGNPPYNTVWSTSPPQYGTSISNIPPGTYTVTVTEGSCVQQIVTDTVIISDGNSIPATQLSDLTPTNVFSPNNDGINDLFFPFVEFTNSSIINDLEHYNLKIFDRWGNKIFETNAPAVGWDGTNSKKENADNGVYFWMLNGKTNCSNISIEYKGFVNLER